MNVDFVPGRVVVSGTPVDCAADRALPEVSATVSSAEAAPGPGARPKQPRSTWRAVALPSEYGGWGLTAEPVILGLLIEPSGAGVAIGLAAGLAFLARTPLKVVLVDHWRRRSLPRTRIAGRIAVAEVASIVGLLAIGVTTGGPWSWVPLALAAPAVGIELWFDMRSRSRRLTPELAGTIGIGSVAAAIVLAGGGSAATAAGAWLLTAARAVASLPFVRYQLRKAKGQPHRRWAQDLAQLAALTIVVAASAFGLLPWAAAAAIGALAVVQLTLARIRPPKAVIVGVQQLFLGLAVMITGGLAMT